MQKMQSSQHFYQCVFVYFCEEALKCFSSRDIFTSPVLYFYQLYMSAVRLVFDSVSFAMFVDIWVIDTGLFRR